MTCKKCGSPLPSEGAICKFCGAMMTPDQISYNNRMQQNKQKKIELLSEKYGQENNVGYREKKENKILGTIIIIVVLLILIIITILLNI